MEKKLTGKQQQFVSEYLVDLNATQAAIRAGYSQKTAYSQGQRMLKDVEIQAAIQMSMQAREERTEVTQDKILAELARIAFGDLRDAVTWGPRGVSLKASELLTDEQAAAIAEVAETVTKDGGSTRIKRHDKVKALELLMRHNGMLNDKLNVSGEVNLIAAIEAGRARATGSEAE